MEITEVRVFLADEDRLKAYVTMTFDNSFVVRDLKVIRGNSGLFVAMPSKKKKDGTYKDIAHPINSEFRSRIERIVLDKYNDEAKMVQAGFSVKRASEDFFDDETPDHAVNPVIPQAPEAHEQARDHEQGIGPRSKV